MADMSSISDFCCALLFISLSAFLTGQGLKKLIKAMMSYDGFIMALERQAAKPRGYQSRMGF